MRQRTATFRERRAHPDRGVEAAPAPVRRASCPCCDNTSTDRFFHFPEVPVFCNVLHDTPSAARAAPRADVDLHHCARCGMIYNAHFDPSLVRYADGYENSLYHSPRFRDYAHALVAELADRHDLAGKLIVEVGCGDGRFLRALCGAAAARGVGFDPSAPPEAADDERVSFRRALFVPAQFEEPFHLIVSRHVLEHIHEPLGFLRALHTASARTHATLFFEVPNAHWTLRHGGAWDIIYEHCSCFTPRSLAALFQRAGFDVLDVRPRYGEQFLSVEARAASVSTQSLVSSFANALPTDVDGRHFLAAFAPRFESLRAHWRSTLDDPRAAPAVIWGAGSKGVTFLNAVDPGRTRIAAAIDLNPRKHNRFTPASAHPVFSPESLRDIDPRTIIVMNPLYLDEIRRAASELNLRAVITPVGSTD